MNISNKSQVLLELSPLQLCESGAPKYHCWQVKWSCRGEKGDFRIGAPWEQSCLLFLFIFDSPITDDLPHGINCGDSFLTSFWQCKHTFQSYLNILVTGAKKHVFSTNWPDEHLNRAEPRVQFIKCYSESRSPNTIESVSNGFLTKHAIFSCCLISRPLCFFTSSRVVVKSLSNESSSE